MALISKTAGKCNLSERQVCCPDHVYRFFNPDLPDVFSKRASKIPCKVFGNSDGVDINYSRHLF